MDDLTEKTRVLKSHEESNEDSRVPCKLKSSTMTLSKLKRKELRSEEKLRKELESNGLEDKEKSINFFASKEEQDTNLLVKYNSQIESLSLNQLIIGGLIIRISCILVIVLLGNLFTPLDSSALLVSRSFLHPICNWDGIHFYKIALKGYQYEHNTAFFPLYPILLRYLGYLIGIEASSIAINLVSFVVSAFCLYKITLIHSNCKSMAVSSLKWFIFTPAIAFHSGMYSESIFTCLFLLGYLAFLNNKDFASVVAWIMCGFCRSNGLLFCGFFGLSSLLNWRQPLIAIKRTILATFIVLPFFVVQFYFMKKFSFLHFVSYSDIQSKYW